MIVVFDGKLDKIEFTESKSLEITEEEFKKAYSSKRCRFEVFGLPEIIRLLGSAKENGIIDSYKIIKGRSTFKWKKE